MEIKKSFTFLLILLLSFGVMGVVSAASDLTLINPVGGNYYKGIINIQWSFVGTPDGPIRISFDDGGGWEFLDQVPEGETSYNWNTDGKNGDYRVYVYEKDTGADAVSDVFTIDNTPPTSSASVPDYQNTATFDVSFTVDDANPNFVALFYKKDGGDWISYGTSDSSSISFTASEEGVYEFYTIATDLAGNVESSKTTADDSTTVDTIEPVTTDLGTDTNWHNLDVTVTLTPTDERSDIANTYYCVDQLDSCDPTTSGTSITVNTEGVNYVRYYSVDNAGNAEEVKTAANTVKIDTRLPTTSLSPDTPEEGVLIVSEGATTITVTCNDENGCSEVGYQLSVSCSTESGGYITESEYEISFDVSSETDVCTYAKDSAGNKYFSSSPTTYKVFTSIQDAITVADSGNTINVAAGTYTEYLDINKPVTLQGAGVGSTIIDMSGEVNPSAQDVVDIDLSSGNVIFDGFEIKLGESMSAIDPQSSDPSSIITISNNKITGYAGYICLDENIDYGVLVQINSGKIVINDNEIDTNCNPILLERSPGETDIFNNILYAKDNSAAIWLMTLYGVDVTSLQNIHNNTINVLEASTGGIGVRTSSWWTPDSDGKFTNIEIINNTITNVLANTYGIKILNDKDDGTPETAVIDGTIINGNTITGSDGTGIILGGLVSDTIINNNTISGVDTGIKVDKGKTGSVYPTGTLVNENSITNSETYGLNWLGTDTLNATFNWWGDLDPSNQVSANVDFDPFAEDTSFTRFFAPVLDAVEDQPVDEGSLLTFTVTASDADSIDTLTYSASNLPAGASFNVSTQEFSWTPTDNGVFNDVEFKVTDGFIEVSELITITVTNANPVVEAGVGQTVDEGDLVTIDPTFTDAGSSDTHTATIDWDDGSSIEDLGTVTSPISATHRYLDNGESTTVTLTITDDDGGIGSDTLIVTVENVAPTASATSNTTGVFIGELILFTGDQIDPGADTFTYLWDFDDGPTSTEQNPTHSYGSGGTYTVILTVTDDDGGSDTDTITILVNDLIWDLASPWNLVSSPKTTAQNMAGLVGSIFGYDNGWVTNPVTIEAGMGYWISSSEDIGLDYVTVCTFPQCLPSGKINIDALNNGWNLIGLTTDEETTTANAFGSMIYDTNLPVYYVISYDETKVNVDGSIGGFNDPLIATSPMNPGEGYWVYVVK